LETMSRMRFIWVCQMQSKTNLKKNPEDRVYSNNKMRGPRQALYQSRAPLKVACQAQCRELSSEISPILLPMRATMTHVKDMQIIHRISIAFHFRGTKSAVL
jgi:hypothetical protein